MNTLFIPNMNSADENQDAIRTISDLARAFAKAHPELQENVKDFPVEEGFAETAKEDMIFTTVLSFLTWLKDQPTNAATPEKS